MVEILKLSGPPTAGRPICMIHAGIAGRIEAAGREVKRPVADPGTAWMPIIHDTAVGSLGAGAETKEVTMAGRASGGGQVAIAGTSLATSLAMILAMTLVMTSIAPRPASAALQPESQTEPQIEPEAEPETPSAPPSVQTALEAFHLTGRWAVRCDRPRGTDNWYGTYTIAPNGEGQLVFSAGDGLDNIYIIEDARRLSATRLLLSESLNGETFDVVLRFQNGRYRTEDVRRSDGSYQVRGGRFVGVNGRVDKKVR
jgi:hypothetical protein